MLHRPTRFPALRAGLPVLTFLSAMLPEARAEPGFVLVEAGVSRAPIVVAADAPPATRRAADELAVYVEKISGARPQVLAGCPDPLPEHALWVGHQPAVDALFPEIDFAFEHPEEILIAASPDHLVIAGRDRIHPEHRTIEVRVWGGRPPRTVDLQMEYGTANAVYTFLQERLGVRWLWPGGLGEDILPQATLSFAPFVHRFHPVMRLRDVLPRQALLAPRHERYHAWADWARLQRLQLGSLRASAGGHAFTKWVDRFAESHPEYFALQPDGSRLSWGNRKGDAKVCLSHPEVQAQWLQDSEERLRQDPTMTFLPAGENDGHSSWICVCGNCRAWDSAQGAPWTYFWKGVQQEYVAMSDRYVTFWNLLAAQLKERFPGREDLLVGAGAYGPSIPPPVGVRLAENTLLAFVGNFPGNRTMERWQGQKEALQGWAAKGARMIYRPNLFYVGGCSFGFPEIGLRETARDFRFLAENGCVGITVDMPSETWGTMAPQYYLMGQLAWNPWQDADALLADYYRRGFGPAAAPVGQYWTLLEEAHETLLAAPEYQLMLTGPWQQQIPVLFPRVFDAALQDRAETLLRQAETLTAGEVAGLHGRRVAFVRSGFEFLRRMLALIPIMTRVRESGGTDTEAVRQALALWEEIRLIDESTGSIALDYTWLLVRMRTRSFYKAGVEDYFGPPSETFQRAAGLLPAAAGAEAPAPAAQAPAAQAARTSARPQPAEEAWRLVFSDDFQREELGADWRVLEGEWAVSGGELAGHGMLLLDKPFPAFHRLEFEAATDAGAVVLFGERRPAEISDLSCFLQAPAAAGSAGAGYLFQFGGQRNTLHRILRAGETFRSQENPQFRIEPARRHRIVAENDAGALRLTVDGQVLLEGVENASFVGKGQEHAGLYLYTPARIFHVKLYVKSLADDRI